MHKYLVTSTTTATPWIPPVLKFFFIKIPNTAAHSLHIPSLNVTLAPALNIIIAIKFVSLPPIQYALEKLSLGYPKTHHVNCHCH